MTEKAESKILQKDDRSVELGVVLESKDAVFGEVPNNGPNYRNVSFPSLHFQFLFTLIKL